MRNVPVPALIAVLISASLGLGGAAAYSHEEAAGPAPHVGPTASSAGPPTAQPSAAARASAPPRAVRPALHAPTRHTIDVNWRAFATVGPVTLDYPVDVVEVVGFHESTNDGARQQRAVPGAGRFVVLETRERGTRSQGAADIVVQPGRPVRAPVTGRVIRAGSYTLYCHYRDNYVVIEPDARPGWEVKLLHFQGLAVSKGDRVRAGVTVVGAHARRLPFASQVDEHTVAPHWPHVHVEVDDPSIPDRPSKPCD